MDDEHREGWFGRAARKLLGRSGHPEEDRDPDPPIVAFPIARHDDTPRVAKQGHGHAPVDEPTPVPDRAYGDMDADKDAGTNDHPEDADKDAGTNDHPEDADKDVGTNDHPEDDDRIPTADSGRGRWTVRELVSGRSGASSSAAPPSHTALRIDPDRPPDPLPPMFGNPGTQGVRRALERGAGLLVPLRPQERRSAATQWAVSGSSHQGFRRRRNEDSYLATPTLAVVADGVGGGPAGHVASELAVRALQAALVALPAAPASLEFAVQQAAAALFGASVVDPELTGMATTLDAVVLGPAEAATTVHGLHVGDGAAWIVSDAAPPRMLTVPHRAPTGMLEHALTTDMAVDIEAWAADIEAGDRIVLATDGFFGTPVGAELARRQLEDVRGMAATDAAEALVRAALGAGGRDNVSVVVVDLLGEVDKG